MMNRLFDAQSEIFSQLQKEEAALQKILQSNSHLHLRWLELERVVDRAQMKTIKKFGWEVTFLECERFKQEYMEKVASDETFRKLNEEKWSFLFEKAFGFKEYKNITLEQARSLMTAFEAATIHEDFLQKVDQAIQEDSTVYEKMDVLGVISEQLYLSVLEKHGFPGEEGYCQVSRAFMDYSYDPTIREKGYHASEVVYIRAKL